MADDSKATDVGARYAQALFELAKDQGDLAAVEADLKSLKAMRAESADLRTLIASPAFNAETKGNGLAAIAERRPVLGAPPASSWDCWRPIVAPRACRR